MKDEGKDRENSGSTHTHKCRNTRGNVTQMKPKYTGASRNHNHLWLDKSALMMCGWIYSKQTLNLIFTALSSARVNCLYLVLLHLFSYILVSPVDFQQLIESVSDLIQI